MDISVKVKIGLVFAVLFLLAIIIIILSKTDDE